MLFNEFHRLIETSEILKNAGISEDRSEEIASVLPSEISVPESISYFDPGRIDPPEQREWELAGDDGQVATLVLTKIVKSCPTIKVDEAAQIYRAVGAMEREWRDKSAEEAILQHIYGDGGADDQAKIHLAGY